MTGAGVIRQAVGLATSLLMWTGLQMAQAQTVGESPRTGSGVSPALDPVLPPATCPEEVESLTEMLLRDLPSYTNRVIQRSFSQYRSADRPGTVIVAGQPDFDPLSTGPGIYQPLPAEDPENGLHQVFFTTLERQYLDNQIIDFQNFHWAFLTESEGGWRLALLFSSQGPYLREGPPSPPEDASQGATAQAIQLWLRDCRAGRVKPAQPRDFRHRGGDWR